MDTPDKHVFKYQLRWSYRLIALFAFVFFGGGSMLGIYNVIKFNAYTFEDIIFITFSALFGLLGLGLFLISFKKRELVITDDKISYPKYMLSSEPTDIYFKNISLAVPHSYSKYFITVRSLVITEMFGNKYSIESKNCSNNITYLKIVRMIQDHIDAAQMPKD